MQRVPSLDSLFHKFDDVAMSFNGDVFLEKDMQRMLTIATEGNLSIVWAPFEHVCESARVVAVGICPGRAQAENGLRAFRSAMAEGLGIGEALRQAKLIGSFSGSMRSNFVNMLDHIGLNRVLRVQSCGDLFSTDKEYVHFTSAIRYPVFVNEQNYRGTPDMLRTPFLRKWIDSTLAEEAHLLRHTIWIPMGPTPAAALSYLVTKGVLSRDQILEGLPHPSGANAERISYFLGHKRATALSKKTNATAIDRAREDLMQKIAKLASSSNQKQSPT